ncbi:MAG: PAS domain S-box protein [Betaproteobacteria bacterium]|nr:MAG: PAS domain S-box protein [Betaproteobacteria bacterium]
MKRVDRELADVGPADPVMLRALLDHIPGRVIVLGTDHRYLYVNHEFLQFFGLRAEQALGRHVAELLGDEIFESYVPVAERLLGGESIRWEGWVDYPAQGRRYTQEHLLPYAPVGGAVRAVIAFGRDLTELKLREHELAEKLAALQASEALKSAIVDHALVALISTDGQGRIVEFNPAAELTFGRLRADMIGQRVSDIVMPERFRSAHEAGLARLEAGGEARVLGKRQELHALRADGSEFPIEMVLWRTDVGGAAFYTASIVDLTERRNAAQEIERQREALRQSEKLNAMGSLLAGVAHELNNPLAIVMGRATLLESKCDDSALRADAQRIREAAERCGRIVRTFLDMARQKPVQRRNVQVNDMVRGAVELLQYNLRTGGIDVELRLADALPEVLADPDQIGQVLLNLLVNAQQALSTTPRPRRVLIETGLESQRESRAPRVWLRVADNGPGISEEHRAHVFTSFFTTKSAGVGTGLGLSVSRSVIREHGGDLLLEGHGPLGGASFRMSIPLSAAPPAPEPVALPDAVDAPLSRVLVVDDEPELASLMRDILEAAQFEVAHAETGAVALELLGEARFDAIVSDLRMPDMDGAALWREVRERHPLLLRRMVFVTGDTLSPAAAEFLRETGCAALEKPFAPADLVARVRALLPAGV